MGGAETLRLLAERAGVWTSYDDVFGVAHDASDATLRAVLAALGFDVADEARASASLLSFDRRRVRRILEPVYVISDRAEATVAYWSAGDDVARGSTWTLTLEDGAVRSEPLSSSPVAPRETLDVDGVVVLRRSFSLGTRLPLGYHRLRIELGARVAEASVIVAPSACAQASLPHGLGWGLAVQLYRLRSTRDAGIGDLHDLQAVCELVRDAGGAFVAVNPLHWLPRGEASPYAPTSRRFVNWLALDIARLPGARDGDIETHELARLRAAESIDYARVADLKGRAARRAFERFRSEAPSEAHDDFARFRNLGGDVLREACTFAALSEHFASDAGAHDWGAWPAPYRTPQSDAVAAFARDRDDDLAYFAYLQWQADEQLAAVARACAGMAIGLYRDLAVGTQLGGFDTWRAGNALCARASVGAPPDLLNRAGQDWGVAPFDPLALREAAYAPFIELVRANVRHAGALRIDHVMGLLRLWWIPQSASPTEGAYVGYRLDELLAILALESSRERFIVIGEDLGTVPAGFRERLAVAGVFSSRVLQFEHDDERFFSPEEYPSLALVSTGTHDLPTMAGFWSGVDIDARIRAGRLGGDEAIASERSERERARLLAREAFAAAGHHVPSDVGDAEIARIAAEFLASSPATLLAVQLEDVLGEREQVNLPATTHEHPNWRTRHAIAVEDLATDLRFIATTAALAPRRGARARRLPAGTAREGAVAPGP